MFKVIKIKYQITHWEYKCMWTETSGRFCVSQRRDGGWGWVRLHSGRLWEKHTSSYSSNSNQFQSRGGRNFYTSGPRKKNKYTEVEREEITSLRETERGGEPLDSDLQIKKQSNQSCQRALIPGCSYQAAAEWNRTRLEYANLFVLSGWLGRGGGGGGKDKWAFQGMTQRPVKSLLSQTLINHCNRSY